VCGPWGQIHNPDYNPLVPSKTRGRRLDKPSKTIVYNSTNEPLDFFFNLICPSLNCDFWDTPTNQRTAGWDKLKGSPDLGHPSMGYEFDKVVKLNYLAYQWQKNVTKFDFKIYDQLKNENYKKVDEELSKTKNVILLSAWDDSYIYEPRKGRNRGNMLLEPGYDENTYNVVNYWDYKLKVIKKIDDFCLKNPDHRIIIANKKAQDWTRQGFLKSNYFDMRVFEKMGISFSQALNLMAKNSQGLISYINSMQNWLCNAKNLNTVLWYPSYHYGEAVCDENPEGILTAVIMNLPRFLTNPEDISEEQIRLLFEGAK
jgi:hypothetical protein